MNVAVFGAGYVGCVTAACLATLGHWVALVEIAPEKLKALRAARSPVEEPGLQKELGQHLQSGQIVPVASAAEAVAVSTIGLICVGTPSQANGAAHVGDVHRILSEVALLACARPEPYVIVLRSTVPSPVIYEDLLPELRRTVGERFERDIVFALNPEFLREGCAIEDFYRPPFIVAGTESAYAAEQIRALYAAIDAPFFAVSVGSASLLKYACNAFHAVKATFANEIGSLEHAFSADADAVMRIFRLDTKLNASPAYLAPGYAVGGPCLPKDLRAVTRIASLTGVACPLLESTLRSNDMLVQRSVDAVVRLGQERVTVVGLSFKNATDDLRESPLVELAERLLGKGFRLRIFDPDVRLPELQGRNLRYVEQRLHHLASLMAETLDEAVEGSGLVIVGKAMAPVSRLPAICAPGTRILDLVRCVPRDVGSLRVVRLDGSEWVSSRTIGDGDGTANRF